MTDAEEKAYFMAQNWAMFLYVVFTFGLPILGFIGGNFYLALIVSWFCYNTICAIDHVTAALHWFPKLFIFTIAGPIIGSIYYLIGMVARFVWLADWSAIATKIWDAL